MADEENTDLMAPVDAGDLMAPAAAPQFKREDAGKGAEDVDSHGVILPRINLLQALSKPVQNGLDGASQGCYWMAPHNRPVTLSPSDAFKFVVVRIYPAQRLWTPIDEGGGLVCEAAGGDLRATNPMGKTGCKIVIDTDKKGNIRDIDWDGGEPTDNCRACAYGLGAAALAASRDPLMCKPNAWLPKMMEVEGEMVRVPDDKRAPKCQSSQDVLGLVLVPEYGGLSAELLPAFISFTRTGEPAGRQLAGMIKLAAAEPAWAKIYEMSANQVQNDKGTFYVPQIKTVGYAQEGILKQASDLYDLARDKSYRPDVSNGEDSYAAPVNEEGATVPADKIKDDEAAPEEGF